MTSQGEHPATYGHVSFGQNVWTGRYCVFGYPNEVSIRRHMIDGVALEDSIAPVRIGDRCIIGNYVCIYEGVEISSGVVIEDHVRIGYNSKIGENARIMYGAFICDRVSIARDACIAGFICDDTQIGERSTAMGDLVHEYSRPHQGWWEVNEAAPIVEHDVVIGFGATIIGGIRISSHVYIASRAIVTRDVPSGYVVKGINEQIPIEHWKGPRLGDLLRYWSEKRP